MAREGQLLFVSSCCGYGWSRGASVTGKLRARLAREWLMKSTCERWLLDGSHSVCGVACAKEPITH